MLGNKIIITLLLWVVALTATAQRTGTIAHHDWPVWILPNDSCVVVRDSATRQPVIHQVDSSLMVKVRVNGFRVQLYSGGNSRKDKIKAIEMAHTAKMYFEESPIYTQFISPHWICRMGDFVDHAEALHMLHKVRETGRFSEAVLVKCKVNSWQIAR